MSWFFERVLSPLLNGKLCLNFCHHRHHQRCAVDFWPFTHSPNVPTPTIVRDEEFTTLHSPYATFRECVFANPTCLPFLLRYFRHGDERWYSYYSPGLLHWMCDLLHCVVCLHPHQHDVSSTQTGLIFSRGKEVRDESRGAWPLFIRTFYKDKKSHPHAIMDKHEIHQSLPYHHHKKEYPKPSIRGP